MLPFASDLVWWQDMEDVEAKFKEGLPMPGQVHMLDTISIRDHNARTGTYVGHNIHQRS
jgi:hypothetical protein